MRKQRQRFLNIVFGLLLLGYLLICVVCAFTESESIDEYSLDYWSSRVADNPLSPYEALRLPPTADQTFGRLGFLRSGYFVYDTSLQDVDNGAAYKIVPMIHLVPIYIHGLLKLAFGKYVFHFAHIIFLLGGFLLPLHHAKKIAPSLKWTLTAIVLLTSPALAGNATYVMSDSVGVFSLSTFLFAIYSSKRNKGRFNYWNIALIAITPIGFVFYKPFGFVFVPFTLFIIVCNNGFGWKTKTLLASIIVSTVAAVTIFTGTIYPSPFWAGYNNVLNHYLYKTHVDISEIRKSLPKELNEETVEKLLAAHTWDETTQSLEKISREQNLTIDVKACLAVLKNADRTKETSNAFSNIYLNISAFLKPVGMFFGMPLAALFIFRLCKDLIGRYAARRESWVREMFSPDTCALQAFLGAIAILLAFFLSYSQSPDILSHVSITNPMFRYLLTAYLLALWGCALFASVELPRRPAMTLFVLQLIFILAMPHGIPPRLAYRLYNTILAKELRAVVTPGNVIVGGYKYDKFFDPTEVFSYAFIAHQRNYRYTQCIQTHPRTLGSLNDVVESVIEKGYTPILIYPDYALPDTPTIENPYEDLDYEEIAAINMTRRAGIFGRFLPATHRVITISRLKPKPPQ